MDHTLGTSEGMYAVIDTSIVTGMSRAAELISQPMPPTGANGTCLTFFYHM